MEKEKDLMNDGIAESECCLVEFSPQVGKPVLWRSGNVDEEKNLSYLPSEIEEPQYSVLKEVTAKEDGKFDLCISCGDDPEGELKDYHFLVGNDDILQLKLVDMSPVWAFGCEILPCRVRVSDLQEGSVKITLLEVEGW